MYATPTMLAFNLNMMQADSAIDGLTFRHNDSK